MDHPEDERKRWLKNKNPSASASWISQIFLGWTLPILVKGYKTDLTEDDLTEPLKAHESSRLGNRLEKAWLSEAVKNKPSLLNAIIGVFGVPCSLLGINFLVIDVILRSMEPLLLHQLLHYFATFSHLSLDEAKLYAWGLILTTALTVIISQPMSLGMLHLGLKLRVALSSMIYRKVLRLNKQSVSQMTAPQIENYMSNDVTRLEKLFSIIHTIWVIPVQVVVLFVIMWEYIGVACVFGTAAILLLVPLQSYMRQLGSKICQKTSVRTEERVRLMNEIINGIHVIKMHTWEKAFKNVVAKTRRKEIHQMKKTSFIYAFLFSFLVFHARASLFATVLAYVFLGYQVTAEKVFLLTSIFSTLQRAISKHLPTLITQLVEGKEALERIQAFLLSGETCNETLVKFRVPGYTRINEAKTKPIVRMRNVSTKWLPDSNENCLWDISHTFEPGKLTVIVGPAGSGKTSLIQALLNEMTLVGGSITIAGTLSYAPSEHWMFESSIKQNILMGSEYDEGRYKRVIDVCALQPDLKKLPFGDQTIVGERGLSLSFSQRARVNLARAVYKEADIYLLDEPLLAVGLDVRNEIFEECILRYLGKKTVILVTHQLDFIWSKSSDYTILMDQGHIKLAGTCRQLRLNEDFILYLSTELERQQSEQLRLQSNFDEPFGAMREESSIHCKTLKSPHYNEASTELPNSKREGSTSLSPYMSYFFGSSKGFLFILVVVLFFSAQGLANASDYWLARWMNLEENEFLLESGTDVTTKREECVDVFVYLTIATIVASLIRSGFYFLLCLESSRRIHDNLYESVVRAAMWFFNTNESGTILNRFSKDMGSIDQVLPATSIEVFQNALTIVGVFFICAWITPWMLVPTVVSLFLFYCLRRAFLPTLRSLKRIKTATRNCILKQVSDSYPGLIAIRALNAQTFLSREFDQNQDKDTSASYLYLACGRSFMLWLDVTSLTYVTIAIMSLLYNPRDYSVGDVGLSVTQAIGLMGALEWATSQATDLEEQMTSVERVLEYSGLESEPSLQSNKSIPKSWPETGNIIFQDLALRDNRTESPVLKSINLTIHSREKIGIIGRKGSGKSSLLPALFRLSPFEGQIIIDGYDSSSVDLMHWRSKISIIPQTPVLFAGTVRNNLDPFETSSDDTLWRTLEEIGLRDVILNMKHGLQSKITEGGSNLSICQRQLICLGRAVVKNNNILVLDEATSNIDSHTGALIHRTIKRLFKECTVLVVTNQVETIMDSDKVLVLDEGSVVEFDHPHVLLQKENSIFRSMVENSGKSIETYLEVVRIAEESSRDTKKTEENGEDEKDR